MLKLLRAFWKTFVVLMALLGIIWLPKDVQDVGEAAEPWQRAWAMVDQNSALWVTVSLLGAWIIWTDLRPFVRAKFGRKYPARHAAILHELAERLAYVRQLAMVGPGNDITDLIARRQRFEDAANQAGQCIAQITYDPETSRATSLFLTTCAKLYRAYENRDDGRSLRQEVKAMSAPLFQALHEGRSISPDAIRASPQLRDTE